MSSPAHVLVTIGDNALNHFSKTVEKLRKAGLKVVKAMENVGIVRGEIPKSKLKALSDVEGVEHVREEQEVRLSPPEE
jgi:NifB/MoaA-like Fe-S oxidoreductase